ncbi:alpha-D-glucose phosphate-specific phosphoglucomutase [Halarchaeum rubridurum]|uniref:Phosphoglucomutase n=1 Tax=Halarchaeum rubridurum TaxID=489911 RepID=A0A830FPY2_9EURY|nr:phosphoglucomutase/phosphomannomutase family protein [Halarchaeum rubridurum]MBP1954342.1 alpha-D-glucose phosphate-specific phosphoglucomutase [Halarchaeum rubridurum]GGM59296.1 phosphoglucomutase [Halarchaeum rubridurum]
MDDAIAFGTDGWRATLDVFTTPRVRAVAQATADHLADVERAGETVAVGYDARPTSRDFAEEIADVLAANGHDVVLPERDCPTPLVAHAIVERDLAGALVVTASHNPPEYNGVKFIPADGAPALPHVTEAIEAHLRPPVADPDAERGDVAEVDLVTPHAEHCRDLVDADLDGLSVVYDAMHGSGRGVTDRLLEAAGADVERLRCERDAEFGGTPPDPDDANLQGLALAVQEHDADLGIANDGDADRIAVVTPERGFLDENRFFAATYDYLLETRSGPAVRTVSTSSLVDRVAEAHGEDVYETAVGFKWIAEEMKERDALMGGEESGGFSVRGHVREKDGVLMALVAAAAAAAESYDERAARLAAEHGDVVQSKVSVDCPDDRKAAVVRELADALPETVAGVNVAGVNDADGFKVRLADDSWLLVRPSGTEPKMRVYAEADSDERVRELLDAGRDLVEPLV